MLKTQQGDELVCITQPDHAAISGFLAAHWGNETFARPGGFAPSDDPEALRDEVLFAISQHDNGWWEWEASPRLAKGDGLPVDLIEVFQHPLEGTERWRIGVRRFQDTHPYASLLISFHAYWLYAPRANEADDPAFRHPLFGDAQPPSLTGWELEQAETFLAELRDLQEQLRVKTAELDHRADWLKPEHHLPHGRLLQLLDAISLALCSRLIPPRSGEARGFGQDPIALHNVPRRSWEDRVTLSLRPGGKARIAVAPYPFDRDPLDVVIPRKRFSIDGDLRRSAWYAAPQEFVTVRFARA
jgi:hypothetical protein